MQDDNHDSRARRWRERAAELRAIADAMDDKIAKADLVRLAAKWEKMAEGADAKSRQGGPLSPQPEADARPDGPFSIDHRPARR